MLCLGYGFISALVIFFTGYVYLVDRMRPPEDPAKKYYDISGVIMAPVTWPFFVVITAITTFLKAILFGIVLVLFTMAMLVIREPIFWEWLEKRITKIGSVLLEVNNFVFNLFFRGTTRSPRR